MAFYVRQKVVCVDDQDFICPDNDAAAPKRGVIYTIRTIYSDYRNKPLVHLDEIRNEPRKWLTGHHEGGFFAQRFRPVIERKTDISIFTEMLTDKRIPAHVHD
ncbi:MAG: hypothetical protein ABIO35_08410 [Nitrobacter sp.]